MDIENELKKFNVTDAAISELATQYMPLIVKGIDDKDGLKIVNAARKVVKGYRIDVDKRRKELNTDALAFQRRINEEAKRITALLEPIENHLAAEEKKIDDEIERIKLEKERAEAARFQARVISLTGLKFMFDGVHYYSTYLDTFNNEVMKVSVLFLKQMTDEVFNDFYENAKHYFDIEEKAIAERKVREEADRKALAEERARLDAIAKEQAEKDAALKVEAERLAALNRYEESKATVIECEKIHERPTIVITQDQVTVEGNIHLNQNHQRGDSETIVAEEKVKINLNLGVKMQIELSGFNGQTYLDIQKYPNSDSIHLEFDRLVDCLKYIKEEFTNDEF